jgi:hypothetical protein
MKSLFFEDDERDEQKDYERRSSFRRGWMIVQQKSRPEDSLGLLLGV